MLAVGGFRGPCGGKSRWGAQLPACVLVPRLGRRQSPTQEVPGEHRMGSPSCPLPSPRESLHPEPSPSGGCGVCRGGEYRADWAVGTLHRCVSGRRRVHADLCAVPM